MGIRTCETEGGALAARCRAHRWVGSATGRCTSASSRVHSRTLPPHAYDESDGCSLWFRRAFTLTLE